MEKEVGSMKYSVSRCECYESCPFKFKLRYLDKLTRIDDSDASNPLKLGTAVHKGIETDVETALNQYFMSYPIIDDTHINESIKLEYLIPKVKELLPEGIHESEITNDYFIGYSDLLVPCTRLDMQLEHGQFDLYDFKYSNNVDHYMASRQLHVYKYYLEKIKGIKIRKMYFVFVPKVQIKQKKTETLFDFRQRIQSELEQSEIQIKQVEYDIQKVLDFTEKCMEISVAETFEKKHSYLCRWCEYENYCTKGDNTEMLPSIKRREIGQITRRRLWIYGQPFSGKTTFVDQAPNPLNLNTDGNIEFVTMPYKAIKDTFEGRHKVLAWDVFKETIDDLEKGSEFNTLVVDLVEDVYESCRLYMYDKLGITHESDDSFRAWDKVRTEFLSTIRRLINLDYENVILISHEDATKDIMKKSGDKITAIKPNLPDKIAKKLAGMVDIVARVVVEDDETRTLNFKSNEVVFGGGRLQGLSKTVIPLEWDELCKIYDEVNGGHKPEPVVEPKVEPKVEVEPVEVVEEPKRTRRTRKARD